MSRESIPVEDLDLETVRDRLRVAERKLALAEAQLAMSRVALPTSAEALPGGLTALGPSLDVLFHTAKVAMMLASLDTTILRANQEAAELFGYPLADLPGRRTIDMTDPQDVDETTKALASIETGQFVVKHYRRSDGSRVAALAMGWPLVDDDGRAVCILGVAVPIRDVSATASVLREQAGLGLSHDSPTD